MLAAPAHVTQCLAYEARRSGGREPGGLRLRNYTEFEVAVRKPDVSQGETDMSSYAYPNPQAIFYQQYEAVRRDEVVGILLALFLGTFGVHHFYLRRTGLGILYLCFCWSGVTTILGFFECFFMPGRVREFNAIQAAGIAAALGIAMPGWGQPGNVTVVNAPPPGSSAMTPAGSLTACSRCQQVNPPGARFCSACGGAL
jgi:TM2 domain-containing membrane protein YozV